MITEHDLAEAIAECEGQRNPNASTCLKLASFYIIRDKMFPAKQEVEPMYYSTKSEEQHMNEVVAHEENESEFRQAVVGLNLNEVVNIMDEVMDTLKIISPRLYDGVMRKLTNTI